MVRGAYASASGMITKYKQIDVTGNNISNINTAGFKKDSLSAIPFGTQLLYNTADGQNVGTVAEGTVPGTVTSDLSEGTAEKTGLPTDLAILSDGFFAVQGLNGVRYTRSGSFTVDAGGYLSLATGQRLLGQNGPVRVGNDDFQVTADGTVMQNGKATDKILLYNSTTPQGAQKQADGFFTLTGAAAAAGKIQQGYLEGSNVNLVEEMTKLMASSRSYQTCQQAFKISDQSVQLAVEQVGSLK